MENWPELLLDEMEKAIKGVVLDKKIGVAFSGGVDSSVVSKLCLDLGYETTLLTVGFAESHDILFAKEVNQLPKIPHKIFEIEQKTFADISTKIRDTIGTDNLSWIENCIAFYYVANLAQELNLPTVVTANGIDELFCGYNAYREAISQGEEKVSELMNSKLENEFKMMKAVNKITSQFDVKILQPFLQEDFIKFAKSIPISEKITSKDDLLRKHVVRKLAGKIGVPEISATKRKKALQYGSNIHKTLIKSR